MSAFCHIRHNRDDLGQRLNLFIGAVGGRQSLEHIRQPQNPRGNGHLIARQMVGDARPVHVFVVSARVFDNVFNVRRERNRFQHFNGHIDMTVDFLSLLGRQSPAHDRQVVKLSAIVTAENVIGAILQQRFFRVGFGRRIGLHAFQFVPRQAQSLVKPAVIRALPDFADSVHVVVAERRVPYV